MSLTPGSRIGVYEITGELGAGAMGRVFRARDTKLNRDVALKVLPEDVAGDTERLARFEREAQVLASLNHPNIAAIYGIEEGRPSTEPVRSDARASTGSARTESKDSGQAVTALVMELVDGETLEERLRAQGPGPTPGDPSPQPEGARTRALPLDDALDIAWQLADALEAAHEKGVIHRDLKPANIKLTPDGQVKVLDFGLAKAVGDDSAADAFDSPTVTSAATRAGVILGTPAYMSPEQARGRPVDRRADIWAFGVVLFEMLTGTQPFAGETATDSLAAVVHKDPDLDRLPADTSQGVRAGLRRCLQKDVKRRLRDIADVRVLIEEADGGHAPLPPGVAGARAPVTMRQLVALAATAGAAIILAAVMAWNLSPMATPSSSRPVTRFTLDLPPGTALTGLSRRALALAPTGAYLAFVADDQLWLRSLDATESRPVPESEGAQAPFFSPDGQWVGFWAAGELRKAAVTGGAPQTLAQIRGLASASWAADDTILLGGSEGVWRVSADGGEPELAVAVSEGEVTSGPSLLPDGETVLFTLANPGASGRTWDDARIVAGRVGNGDPTVIVEGGTDARYVSTGHLVYARDGVLLAAPFDPGELEITGGAAPVLDGIMQTSLPGSGSAHYDIDAFGNLVYVAGAGPVVSDARRLVWVDRRGRVERLEAGAMGYYIPRLSPDRTRVAVDVVDEDNRNIWIYDLTRGTLGPLTFDPAPDTYPLWSPDGSRIIFMSRRDGVSTLYSKAADGSGAADRVTDHQFVQVYPYAWSRGGDIVYQEVTIETRADIGSLRPGTDTPTTQLLATGFSELQPALSPDGNWIAYTSNESGDAEVYVRAFPSLEGKWLISSGGGESPAWSPTSAELFYRNGDAMMAVSFDTEPTFRPGTPSLLFEAPFYAGAGRTYEVGPDGRFLMIQDDQEPATSISFVMNWFEELRAQVAID